MNCLFCAIVSKASPASIVYEDELSLAFLDIYPITRGHTLIIPKKHFASLNDCDEEIAKHLLAVTKKLNIAVCKAVKCEGILNEIMNGEAAGQEIFHLHYHIIPRTKDDGFGWVYPPGYRKKIQDRALLDNVAEDIQKNIKGVI